MDKNRQMNKREHDESFFAQTFPSQILKYGKRSGFIVIGRICFWYRKHDD